jgi:PAS domain S-box-containing protein
MFWVFAVIAVVSVSLLIREKLLSRRTDGQYRMLADASPAAIVVIDDETVLYANSRVVSIVGGGDRGAVVGRPVAEVLAPETAQLAREAVEAVNECRQLVSLKDVPVAGRNGAVVRCDILMVPAVFDGVDAVQCTFHPVDEKHAAMLALHETEERFQRFFEDMPVPMYRTRPDGTIVHANAAMGAMLGIAHTDDLVGVSAASFYTEPGERARLAEVQVGTGLLEDQISMLRTRDGRDIWVRDSSHTIVDGGSEVFEGALVDVTKELLSTRELELRAMQQQSLAHIAQAGLRSLDIGEVLQEAVDQVCAVVSADCAVIAQDQENEGLITTALAYGVDSAKQRERVQLAIEDEVAAMPATGAPIESVFGDDQAGFNGVLIRLVSPANSYGVLAIAGSDLDISGQDFDYLRATAATLTSALWRSRARARLSHLVRAKDEFVASVSHELRTPLTVVAGLALELEHSWRSFQPDETAEFISLIADQSREMSDLIEDLLVAARADIGKVPIYPEDVDLRLCVDQVVESCARTDRARMQVRGDAIIGRVDPVRCRQVIRNLLTNAVRYGGPHIRVLVRREGSVAHISVFDDGQGIAEDDREKVFSAYERAHTTAGVPGSVGLGLTVSRKLTELMGGSIRYRYEGGSHFDVSLPLAEVAVTAD